MGRDEQLTARRGEIWYADIPGDKRRPVVVLTRDSVLSHVTTVLVAPITTRIRNIPTEVPVTGLPRDCVANLDNTSPLPKAQLVEHAGSLSPGQLRALCSAVRFAIDC
ncbi:MAG: type II toxin-antitoxin system PemK/MazF family toxin [Candidatus Dormibacteraceae bacterium]